jgi:hypothetical protein
MSRSSALENPSIGANIPPNFYIGKVWHEISSAGLYLGSWIFQGNYWLSLQTYSHQFTTPSGNGVNTLVYPIDPASNVFLLRSLATINCNAVSTLTVNWAWTISRVNAAGIATNLVTRNSNGLTANTWSTFVTSINQHINVAAVDAVGLRIQDVRSGTISKAGTIGFEYKKARL